MGGSKSKDDPNNLMALCRKCHVKYVDKKQYKDFLKQIKNKDNEKTYIFTNHTFMLMQEGH